MLSAFYFLLSCSLNVFSTQDQAYGLGGLSTARTGSVLAEPDSAHTTLLNPALLALQPSTRLALGSSWVMPHWRTTGEVLLDHPLFRTREGTETLGNIDLANEPFGLWSAGVSVPFRVRSKRVGVGLQLSGAYQALESIESKSPYDFQLLRFNNSDRQFKGTASLGIELLKNRWSLGAGLSFYILAAGNADVYVGDSNPTGRLKLDVSLNAAPLVGSFFQLGQFGQLGLLYRSSVSPSFEQQFTGQVTVTPTTGTVTLPAYLKTNLYMEPETWEVDYQYAFTQTLKTSVGLSYQRWNHFKPTFIEIQTTDTRGVQQNTQTFPISLTSTWNPRASLQFDWTPWLSLSGGYQYRPSPLPTESGPLNWLDAPMHVFGFGTRIRVAESFFEAPPIFANLAAHYAHASYRSVVKGDSRQIGFPGYGFSGNSFSLHFGLEVEI